MAYKPRFEEPSKSFNPMDYDESFFSAREGVIFWIWSAGCCIQPGSSWARHLGAGKVDSWGVCVSVNEELLTIHNHWPDWRSHEENEKLMKWWNIWKCFIMIFMMGWHSGAPVSSCLTAKEVLGLILCRGTSCVEFACSPPPPVPSRYSGFCRRFKKLG